MLILRFALIAGLLLGSAGLVWKIAPSKSKLLVLRQDAHFPMVSGFNLNRQEFEYPRDFGGDLNLVIIAFQQYHQFTVNTWIPFAQEIEATFPGFIYYEFPTINEMSAFSRTFINEGMRAGIPDQTARERTITLYLDKDAFNSALDIPNENDIHLFLVDQDGNIIWRTTGEHTEDKASELTKVIKDRYQQE